MKYDADAVRARAEANFTKPEQPSNVTSAAREDQALRDRTARLKEQRLAKEAIERKAAEVRTDRRRNT